MAKMMSSCCLQAISAEYGDGVRDVLEFREINELLIIFHAHCFHRGLV
jgi:hypothetical protein